MTPASYAGEIQKISQHLLSARHAIGLTGAGISTPSGIPDFRGDARGDFYFDGFLKEVEWVEERKIIPASKGFAGP